MYTCEQLIRKIDNLRDELINISYNMDCLSDPELVRKSQELDRLISLFQLKHYKN
ncbi:Spo0E family sporulation regulatory protein-aspartic acid phosphatase [Fictibacillus nanhaiensis]|uniref:Spo0E family sporulation regulatory protein-aspartic acid phosphatase n=1 Tax=Fictibacillus nanhaiensis TaxID=742169 RepID=UPI003AF32040